MSHTPNLDLRTLSDRPVNKRVLSRHDLDPWHDWDMLAGVMAVVFIVGVCVGVLLR